MIHIPNLLESTIERKTVKYLKEKYNIWCEKSSIKKGYPDRICISTEYHTFFIEFKQKGKKPTALQKHCIEMLKDRGFDTLIIDDYENGIKQIEKIIKR